MFQKARRLFSAGLIGLLVIATLHTIGQFSQKDADPQLISAISAMNHYTLSMGFGMNPSVYEIYKSFSLTMSITLVWLGLQHLLVAAPLDSSEVLIRRQTLLSILGVGALILLYAVYRIPPPLLTLCGVEVLFILSWFRQRRVQA